MLELAPGALISFLNKMMWTARIQMKWVCDHRSESQFKQFRKNPEKKNEMTFSVSFLSRVDELNKLASLQYRVFIAQLGEHCSANAEATGLNPVEAPKTFFSGFFRNCLNCDSLRWLHTHFI